MDAGKRPRLPFDPRSPKYRWLLWKRGKNPEGYFRYYYWRRIAVAMVFAAAALWAALAAGVWSYVRFGRGVMEARYADVLAPWHWGRYRAEISAHYLAMGLAELRRGAVAAGFGDMQRAVVLSPENLEARLDVAEIQFRARQRSAALATLRAGVDYAAAHDRQDYLGAYFTRAFAENANDDVIAAGRRVLPAAADGVPVHRFIAYQVATAQYNKGDYDGATRTLADWKLRGRPESAVLLAWCDWKQGRREAAVRRMESALPRFRNRDVLYVALEQFSYDLGRPERAHHYAVLRWMANPTGFRPRLDLIRADHALGKSSDERREVDAYFADFHTSSQALLLFLQTAVSAGEPALVERAAAARWTGKPAPLGFDLALGQASLVGKDYTGALAAAARAEKIRQPEDAASAAMILGIKSVALFGDGGDGGEVAFSLFLPAVSNLTPATVDFLAGQLRQVGKAKYADLALQHSKH